MSAATFSAARFSQSLSELDRLLAVERFIEARELLRGARVSEGDASGAWRWQLRAAELDLLAGTGPVDEALLTMTQLLQATEGPTEERLRLHGRVLAVWVLKRCFSLAERAEEQALQAHGEAPLLLVRRGDRELARDERLIALAWYERAVAAAPDDGEALYALCNAHYLLSDFDAAEAVAERVASSDAAWLATARLRASLRAARSDHEGEAAVWQELLARHGDGDYVQRDRNAYALALAASDRLAAAVEVLRQVWREDPEGVEGQYARARIEAVEAAPPQACRRRLFPFPTTAQKRHQCGPAVIDLCLRYLDVELDPDQIAAAVSRGEGTPMREISHFLRSQGVASRRIEATPSRLKKAIDCGLPVIVQEEYATTAHVAVITGYDERLGLFLANDPTSHRQLLKSFAWVERAGDLYGNGGVLVLGQAGSQLEAKERELDAAGLHEAEHLVLLDDRERERAGVGEETGSAAHEEVIRLAEEALAREPGFKLAWYERARARIALYSVHSDEHHRKQALAALYDARSRFGADAWPHQLQGHLLAQEERFEEAYVAFHSAWRRDAEDANDLDSMGRCKLMAGDLRSAEEHLLEALAVDPTHRTAMRNLASLYLRQLELADEPAPEGPTLEDDPLVHARLGVPREVYEAVRRQPADVLRRARHFAEVACSRSPQDPIAWSMAGALAIRDRRFSAASAAFRRAAGLGNFAPWTITGLAVAFEQLGQQAMAERVLEAGCQQFRQAAAPWLALAAARGRQQGPSAAVEVLRQAIEQVVDGLDDVVRSFFHRCRRETSAAAAALELRRFAERRRGDAALLRTVAALLDDAGQRGHAIALFRHLVAEGPNDIVALYRLGRLLAKSLITRDEAATQLERVVELAPQLGPPRLVLAWIYMPRNPRRALDVLQPVSDQSPRIWTTRAAALRALHREQEAQAAKQVALACAGDPHEGRLELIDWHRSEGRIEEAARLAEGIDFSTLGARIRPRAETAWLAAHRLVGRIPQIIEGVRELCPEGVVPTHLASDIYLGLLRHDDQLAARAAEVLAREEPQLALTWRIRAAGCRARVGDGAELTALFDQVATLTALEPSPAAGVSGSQPGRPADRRAQAWAELSLALAGAGRRDEAERAAEQAQKLAPRHRDVLLALEAAYQKQGQPEQALRVAERLHALHPYEHHGGARLAATHARLGRVREALEHSAAALDAAPYSEVAHGARALACFMAGRYEEAGSHARQREAMAPASEADRASLLVLHALAGDRAALELGLAEQRQKSTDVYPLFIAKLLEVSTTPPATRVSQRGQRRFAGSPSGSR